jgi:peptide deformylase
VAILPIRIFPDPVLRQKAKPVDKITPEIIQMLDDMLDTMYHAPGIGLAAPQIGLALRLVVVDVSDKTDEEGRIIERKPIRMINPQIIAASENYTLLTEGCLSLPEMDVDVERPETIRFSYTDVNGEIQTVDANDILSKAVQHEIDHLDGKLIFDYLSPLKRDMVLRKYNKKLKSGE